MASSVLAGSSVADRRARGADARIHTPPELHSRWEPTADRPDPISLLEEQCATWDRDLVSVRHARMMVSPFTFYCGGVRIMASDLAATPNAGLMTQLCGDAHLSNFGVFAAPQGHPVFDFCEFDETLPGPFEYDIKRLATSVTVAARHIGLSDDECRRVTSTTARAYRTAMAQFARMGVLELWYSRISDTEITAILNEPPLTGSSRARTPHRAASSQDAQKAAHEQIREFRATLRGERRHLAERFRVLNIARGGGNAGSIGCWACVVLLQGRDERDLLVLQLKEATASVLEDHLPRSTYRNAGERVVRGQRLMQAAADIFLGWTKGVRTNRSYYVRQLWEVKDLAAVDTMPAAQLDHYAALCGRTLAHAHARSGDPIAIDAYLGEHDDFDQVIAEFSRRYADQNDQDYQAFTTAISTGQLPAVEGV